VDYLLHASVPWDYSWMVEQNLAHALAANHALLYVDPPMSPLTRFRYGGRSTNAPHLSERRVRRAGRLQVVRPLSLPPLEHPLSRRVSRPLVCRQIRRAAREAGLDRPVVVSARWTAAAAGAVDQALRVHLVMDWQEAGAELLGRSREELQAETDAACRSADVICATSRRIVEGLAERGHEASLLRHGFPAELAQAYERPAPQDYATLGRPLMGYTGSIDGRLDFELIERLAAAYPEGSVVLVGPVSPRLTASDRARLSSRPNIHVLGPRAREELPAYVAHLDCALLPYRATEWLRYGSPVKMWEYFYAGPPIVGSGCLELKDYPPPLVRFAAGHEQFIAAVAEPDDGREKRREYALANTWDHRAAELDRLVAAKLTA
jgi:glycosyltransferase involved in cell wall biosynthesis